MTNYNKNTSADEVASDFASEIKGRTFLVTGVTWGGIGAETVKTIANHEPALIILAGRNKSKIDETIVNIKKEVPGSNLRPLVLDLASFDSVRVAAKEVNSYEEDIDVLINNAAIMGCPYGKSENGFEMQFASNHLGHFLFTNLILEKLLKTHKPRVVVVSSLNHRVCPVLFDDLDFSDGAKYDGFLAYGQSKSANVLFARELAQRYKDRGLSAFSLHPGVVRTGLSRHVVPGSVNILELTDYWGNIAFPEGMEAFFIKTLSQAASTTVLAALDPSLLQHSGAYLQDNQLSEDACAVHAKDMSSASRLWELSEKLVGGSL